MDFPCSDSPTSKLQLSYEAVFPTVLLARDMSKIQIYPVKPLFMLPAVHIYAFSCSQYFQNTVRGHTNFLDTPNITLTSEFSSGENKILSKPPLGKKLIQNFDRQPSTHSSVTKKKAWHHKPFGRTFPHKKCIVSAGLKARTKIDGNFER